MNTALIPLAILMGLATYPWRAVPLLAPGVQRLPERMQLYLRLVGPAVLATLAAVATVITVDSARRPSLHVGLAVFAVALCVFTVGLRRSLLIGLLLAAGSMALFRALDVAPI